jgi:hypothetical protein
VHCERRAGDPRRESAGKSAHLSTIAEWQPPGTVAATHQQTCLFDAWRRRRAVAAEAASASPASQAPLELPELGILQAQPSGSFASWFESLPPACVTPPAFVDVPPLPAWLGARPVVLGPKARQCVVRADPKTLRPRIGP